MEYRSDSADLFNDLTSVLLNAERTEEALDAVTQALQLGGDEARSFGLLTYVMIDRDDIPGALTAVSDAVQAGVSEETVDNIVAYALQQTSFFTAMRFRAATNEVQKSE